MDGKTQEQCPVQRAPCIPEGHAVATLPGASVRTCSLNGQTIFYPSGNQNCKIPSLAMFLHPDTKVLNQLTGLTYAKKQNCPGAWKR